MSKRFKIILLIQTLFVMWNPELSASPTKTLSMDSINALPTYQLFLDSADLYRDEGKYEKAVNYYDSALNAYKEHHKNQMEFINEQLANAYEIDKKELEIERLNQSLSLKSTQYVLFMIFIVILIISLILLFFTQKYRLQILNQREMQNKNRTILLKLEKEKKELEARLHALETEKYQKELLAGSLLVEHKSNILEELRLFFKNNPTLSKYKPVLEDIMTEQTESSSNEKEFKNSLQSINPNFYTRLQKQANNKLTSLDLKYCQMIYLKMSSKEMSDFLHVDPKTIRVMKYRLKLKLNLDKADDLGGFIEKMSEVDKE